MKTPLAKQSGMKTSLVVGAAAIGAANLHATLVYKDTSGMSLTVTRPLVDDSDRINFNYDSLSQVLALGGSFGKGQDRGAGLIARYRLNAGSYLEFLPMGSSPFNDPVCAVATSLLSGGPILAGTAIGGDGTIEYTTRASEHPLGSGLTDFYVGMRLWEGDTNNSRYNYGWASITTSADGLSATLNGIAFESEINKPINAGDTGITAVPEPGNVVSLAALLSSAALIRKRRKATAA